MGYEQQVQARHINSNMGYEQQIQARHINSNMGYEQQIQARQINSNESPSQVTNEKVSKYPSAENPAKRHVLPTWYQDGRLVTKGINPEGESGRSGFHPLHFFRVAWQSATPWNKWLNLLWPFVPAAIILHFLWQEKEETAAHKNRYIIIFAVCYVGIIPPASLLGFAGQELAKKLPRVWGILLETTLGSVVEIILFILLIVKDGPGRSLIPVIKAAILGSILANLLLCLGACFFVGGLKWRRDVEQKFHPVISEVGSGLLLVAGFGLLVPTAFYSALRNNLVEGSEFGLARLVENTHRVSRGTAIVLMLSFFAYIIYSAFSHDSLFDEVLRQDEEIDADRDRDMAKQKFTLTEAIIAVVISLACVSLLAIFLVLQIEPIVHYQHVPDNFMGLILVPLVEKVAEHITAVDEAYDNQINFALYHCLAPSIQTALFNAPLVVFVGWGLGKKDMDLNFEVFMIIILLLAILVVGNFLRDGASNWLEGALLLFVYIIIALTTFYMPNPDQLRDGTGGENSGSVTGHALQTIDALIGKK